ncbi:MAG TPA: hypothetical protein VFG47_19550 [Geminicoccaceae bacterium]|nr:hypothetical protein [Geminicoccaceae bacterium]
MRNAEAMELGSGGGPAETGAVRPPGVTWRGGGMVAIAAASRRARSASASLGRRLLRRLRHGAVSAWLWARASAGDALLAVAVVLEPALLSAAAMGRLALAVLVFGVLSGVARGIGEALERRAGRKRSDGELPPLAPGWRAWLWLPGALALGLAGALALDPGFAVVALIFLAVQACRTLGAGRSAMLAAVLLALAVVLRVDAGAVALGAVSRPHLLAFASLFGLFLGLCRGRERVLRAPARRWLAELARRYVDVGIAALLCGLIVGYVQVLGHDPAIRAAAGAWAYLSAPFVLGGLLRYWHLAVVEERPVADPGLWLTDPVLAAGVAGCVATLGFSLHL